jgi:hypothetical protein
MAEGVGNAAEGRGNGGDQRVGTHGEASARPILTLNSSISTVFCDRRESTDECRRDRHRLMWQLPQINLVLARVVIPNYVTGIELFVDGGVAQV